MTIFPLCCGSVVTETDGFRTDNGLENNLVNLYCQVAVTPIPQLSVRVSPALAPMRRPDYDISIEHFDLDRRDLDQGHYPGRFGMHFDPSQSRTTSFSWIFSRRDEHIVKDATICIRLIRFSCKTISYHTAPYLDFGNEFAHMGHMGVFQPRMEADFEVQAHWTMSCMATFTSNLSSQNNLVWTLGLVADFSYSDFGTEINVTVLTLSLVLVMRSWMAFQNCAMSHYNGKARLSGDQTIEPTSVAGS